ncbi:MAG: glycosyltransferase [Lachnospiraceae bacterium]|nr:glycosyltransferase [Lachnospiraceae bacterium]
MASNENVKISIIVPVYNTEKYLRECLDSVLSQEYASYEVVCVNDGSTDGSLSILEEYSEKDKRIRVVTTENRGLSAARNKGVSLASGEYICYLDSDDMLETGALNRMVEAVSVDVPDMVVFNARLIYESDDIKKSYNKDAYYNRQIDYGYISTGTDLLAGLIENNQYIETAWIMLLRKTFLQENGIAFCENILHEDTLYSICCYTRAQTVRYKKDINYIYRIRSNSIMTKPVTSHNIISRLICYDEILKIMYVQKLDERTERAIEKYLRTFVDELKTDINKVKDIDNIKHMMKGLSPRLSLHMYAVGLDMYARGQSYRVSMLGFDKLIEDYNDIYIYGIGKVATKVYMYMEKIGAAEKLKAFITTIKQKENVYIGKPIVSLENNDEVNEIAASKALVLVAVRRKYHQEIVELLNDRNIYNYELIDEKIENMIDKAEVDR